MATSSNLSAISCRGIDLYNDHLFKSETFITGIEAFDHLFESNAIESGDVIEINGLPATGKTMLLNTIMINLLEHNEKMMIVFIDSKCDFQPLKLVNMMKAKNIPEAKQMKILTRIEVHRVSLPEDLVANLNLILTNTAKAELKMIMIDSITVPFYRYVDRTLLQHRYMTEVMDLLKSLARLRDIVVGRALIVSRAKSFSYFSILFLDSLH